MRAVDAVLTARPPDDPRVRAVAVRLARQWSRPGRRPVVLVVVLVICVLLSVYVAIAETPWFFFAVVWWPIVGWYAVRAQYDRARRFLRAVGQVDASIRTADIGGGRPGQQCGHG
jgi:hypothetical protein